MQNAGPGRTPPLDDLLFREGEYLHLSIFGRTIPEQLLSSYVAANRAILGEQGAFAETKIEYVVKNALDVEALEMALRRREPGNVLTSKLLILCYLAEPRNDYLAFFVSEKTARLRAFCELPLFTLRSFYKLIKGMYLISRHEIL